MTRATTKTKFKCVQYGKQTLKEREKEKREKKT
jgi:hypothetical protein